jgi:sarcosine oxidase subunit gamma
MPVSAPERVHFSIVQVAAWRGGDAALASRLQTLGWELPTLGRAWFGQRRTALCVQPHHWLLLDETQDPDFVARCREAVADAGAVAELTAARSAWRLRGETARQNLAAGCRLDLAPSAFAIGQAAATTIAQVHATLLASPDGWLLLCSSSVTKHFEAWLEHVQAG